MIAPEPPRPQPVSPVDVYDAVDEALVDQMVELINSMLIRAGNIAARHAALIIDRPAITSNRAWRVALQKFESGWIITQNPNGVRFEPRPAAYRAEKD